MNVHVLLAAGALLVFLGLVFEELGRRSGVPDVLMLVVLGLACGIAGVGIPGPSAIRLMTSMALVLILFEGSVEVRVSQMRKAARETAVLTVLGYVLTAAAVSLVAGALLGLPFRTAILLGAITGGTGPTVVIPMVRALPVSQRLRTALTIESGLSDVISIVATLTIVALLSTGGVAATGVGLRVALQLAGSLALGVGAGIGWAWGLRFIRARRATFLPLAAGVVVVYAAAESFGDFGAIACMAFGLALGNAPSFFPEQKESLALSDSERVFLAEAAFFLKVIFFFFLGATFDMGGLRAMACGIAGAIAVLAVRPFVIRASLPVESFRREEARFAAAMAPKGLAAAVLARVPLDAGIPGGLVLAQATLGLVLVTIIGSSLLVLAARRGPIAPPFERLFSAYPAKMPEPMIKKKAKKTARG